MLVHFCIKLLYSCWNKHCTIVKKIQKVCSVKGEYVEENKTVFFVI